MTTSRISEYESVDFVLHVTEIPVAVITFTVNLTLCFHSKTFVALNFPSCADVLLRNYALTHSLIMVQLNMKILNAKK